MPSATMQGTNVDIDEHVLTNGGRAAPDTGERGQKRPRCHTFFPVTSG